jgi:hypothetical protein
VRGCILVVGEEVVGSKVLKRDLMLGMRMLWIHILYRGEWGG